MNTRWWSAILFRGGTWALGVWGLMDLQKSLPAPQTFPSTASESCAPVIKVTCSSAWIIVVTSVSASGVYHLGEPSNRRLHFSHAF